MKNLFLFLSIFIPLIGCNQTNSTSSKTTNQSISYDTLKNEINELESILLKAQDAKKDKISAEALISKSELFVKQFPKDTSAALVLFKAADVSRGLGEYGKAIQMWGKVWRDYPDFEKAPLALFLQGFTFDANLQDKANAKKYYEQFSEKYPNDKLVEQVNMLLSVIGKSSEELIHEFKKKNE
ncbi:MAG: tetratricopeptide repeat protein [Bacteroidetes bacterium]|jgi:TolA-binding protein|nr:tetratricopeptide repeat protein [Bacteroidota bacterium]